METSSRLFRIEKVLKYLFWSLTFIAFIMTLLNLSAFLGIGHETALLRGWVNYGHRAVQPELLPATDAQIKVFNLQQNRLAMVQFEEWSALFSGLPLAILLSHLCIDLAVLVVFFQLARIFGSLDRGEIFRNDNMPRMRNIAWAVIGYSVFSFLQSFFLAKYIQGSGESFRSAYPAYGFEQISLGILVALIILALTKAFQLGAHLQQEQDLTI